MYIDHVDIEYFRAFRKTRIRFCHADQDFNRELPQPELPNLNLILGNNGLGKTTLLMSVALAALGPAVGDSGIFPYRYIRRERDGYSGKVAKINATFTAHEQDRAPVQKIASEVQVILREDLESLRWTHPDEKIWHPIYSHKSDSFFVVGYGATRRSSRPQGYFDFDKRVSPRAARVLGLFNEHHLLRPLNLWLPRYKDSPQLKGRYVQVVNLLNHLVGKEGWKFTGKQDGEGEYLYGREDVLVPFPALSDGYRAFLGWLGDLLFHICETCPSGKKLRENKGIVLVDEIDLHLHPKWQMEVLQTLAKELPCVQFIVTSHSPLIVGSLQWMNIIVMKSGPRLSSKAARIRWAVHGLDADQILLTDFFGLKSTRAPGKKRTLKDLALRARDGDSAAARQLLKEMSGGTESTQ